MLDSADSSGLSDEKFAAREGINPQRLYYWRRKLDRKKRAGGRRPRPVDRDRGPGPARPAAFGSRSARSSSRRARPKRTGSSAGSKASGGQFVEIKAAPVERIEVQLRNGRLVSAPTSIAPAALAALLDAIEGPSC